LISYGYICAGAEGLKQSTEYAILNANYIKEKLNGHYDTLYSGEMGRATRNDLSVVRLKKKVLK
jgi:glycine dehydrogenase